MSGLSLHAAVLVTPGILCSSIAYVIVVESQADVLDCALTGVGLSCHVAIASGLVLTVHTGCQSYLHASAASVAACVVSASHNAF